MQCAILRNVSTSRAKKDISIIFGTKSGTGTSRTLIMDEAMLVNHLMYNDPEKLQQLLNECKLYTFVKRKVKKYNDAVKKQAEDLCKADKEMKLALAQGDTERYFVLEKNNRLRAEEMSKQVLYAS